MTTITEMQVCANRIDGNTRVDARARLTTDHALSSYGLPVLVLSNGTVLGPGDAPAMLLSRTGGDVDPADRTVDWAARDELFARALRAGYRELTTATAEE